MSAIVQTDDGAIVVLFDQTVSEAHEGTVETTENPVEKGADVTDHVIARPRSFSLELFVTNTPFADIEGRGHDEVVDLNVPKFSPPIDSPGAVLRAAGGALGSAIDAITKPARDTKANLYVFRDPRDRVREVQEALDAIRESRALCNVTTLSKDYEGVVLISWRLTRAQLGGAAFALDFREIETVESASVKAPEPLQKRGKPQSNKGSKGAKEEQSAKKKSMAKQLLDQYLGG